MKNRFITFSLSILSLLSINAHSEESPFLKPHQIYFGPEITSANVNAKIKEVTVKGGKHFGGLRLGYEFLKPGAFYAGADLLTTVNFSGYSAYKNNASIHSSDQPSGFQNLDLRFGYTASWDSPFLSPYLGVGAYGLGTIVHNRGFHEAWVYLSAGLRSKFPINDTFSLGLNLKIFKSFFSFEQFQNDDTNVTVYSYPWGAEVGVPFTWNFNPRGTWTFAIEPYWIKLNFSEKQNVLGSKFLIGVHF